MLCPCPGYVDLPEAMCRSASTTCQFIEHRRQKIHFLFLTGTCSYCPVCVKIFARIFIAKKKKIGVNSFRFIGECKVPPKKFSVRGFSPTPCSEHSSYSAFSDTFGVRYRLTTSHVVRTASISTYRISANTMFSLYEAYISRRDHIYQYTELAQKRNIRLLHVEDSSFTIVERSLDDLPPFEALSYVWGDPNQPHKLYLADGSGSIPLTESLHQAIRHLPVHLGTSYIWIDQICINQQDATERGHQVSLMGEIFGAAQRVLAWLGPETEQVLPFLEILEYREDGTEASQEKFFQAVDSLNDDPQSDLSARRLLAMQQFFGPWFMRVWILQESALASKILLFVGRKSFSWDTIFSTAMRLVKHPEMRVLIRHWQSREI